MIAQKSWSRFDGLALTLFAALIVLFYWRILTPNLADRQSFPPGDFSYQFWAFSTFEVRELSAGRLPLWNPYTFAGAPFWADVQSAVLYPPSLLTLLLSAPWGFSLFALEIEAIFHFWLAATFTYLFIHQITLNRPAAFIAALTFTFSGYLTGYPSQQLAVLEADIWLPLILLFLHRAYKSWEVRRVASLTEVASLRKDWKIERSSSSRFFPSPMPSLLLAGVAWGMTLLAGHPQSALIVAYLSTAYFFFLWLTPPQKTKTSDAQHPTQDPPTATSHVPRPTFLTAVTSWLLFILTGLALAAIQFLPAAAYTLRSVRAEGAYDQMSGGFPLLDVIQFLLPAQVSFYSPLYVGVVGLILAIWIPFIQPNRHVIFWAILACITLLIAFGGNTFLYTPLYLTVPGFSIFRGQERWAFATAFSLCVLAGYGFRQVTGSLSQCNRVAGNKNNEKSNSLRPTPYAPHIMQNYAPISTLQRLTTHLFYLALLLLFLFFIGLNDTGWTPNSPFFDLLSAGALLTLILALAWCLWKLRPHLPLSLFTGLTALLVCFDLFTVNWQTNLYPQLPAWHTQTPAVVTAIKEDAAHTPNAPFRVYNEFRIYDNYGVPFAVEDLWGASPLRPDRYDQFLAPPMPIERTWDLLNVKYVITWRQTLFVPSTIIYEVPAEDGMTYVHRLAEVGPRAWLVSEANIANDAAILETMADPNFDRRRTALVEPEAAPYITNLQSGPARDLRYDLQRTSYTPTTLTYRVMTAAPALLILSEPYYPGWRAVIDGQTAPILRANYILRAIPLSPGEHVVELSFRPLSFTLGAVISAGALIVVIGLLLSMKWGKKNKTHMTRVNS